VESRLGNVSNEIEKICNTLNPYAVIMGTRGLNAMGQFFLGSNSISVIEKIEAPVFIIPPGVRFKPFRKVGLATDMEKVSERIPIKPIKDLVSFFNADMHVGVDSGFMHFAQIYKLPNQIHMYNRDTDKNNWSHHLKRAVDNGTVFNKYFNKE
jgi:hypothetical protein